MAQRKKRSFFAILLSFVSIAACIGVMYFCISRLTREVKTTISLEADIREAKAERDALLKEKEILTDQKEKLQNEDYAIAYARGEFLLTREGEQVFKLPKIDDGE